MCSRALDSLRQISRRFPSMVEPEMTFAYGSGVFQQANHTKATSNMIDMCLVVDKARLVEWHAENLELNPLDYSAMKRLGPEKISALQESSFGAQVIPLLPSMYLHYIFYFSPDTINQGCVYVSRCSSTSFMHGG